VDRWRGIGRSRASRGRGLGTRDTECVLCGESEESKVEASDRAWGGVEVSIDLLLGHRPSERALRDDVRMVEPSGRVHDGRGRICAG